MEPRTTPGLDVEVSHLPVVGWSAAWCRQEVVREVRVANRTGRPLPDLVVRTWIDPTRVSEVRTRGLPPGASLVVDTLDVALDQDDLAARSQPEPGSLWIEVADAHGSLHATPHPIEVLPWDEWTGPGVLPELLAAFCRPDHPLAAAISEPLGYTAVDPVRIADRLRALHDHVGSLAVTPVAWSRRVRAPDRITEENAGSALDVALWIAAVLEGSGLHPVVAVCGETALVGVWLVDHALPFPVVDDLAPVLNRVRSEELVLVEALPGVPYSDAKRAALDALDAGGLVVDVVAARRAGIRPLPTDLADEAPAAGRGPEPRSARLQRWKARLLDLSMRNRLLHLRDARTTLPLRVADLGRFEDLLATGARFALAPRVRAQVELAAAPRGVQKCPWCGATASGERCPSCGGPLPVAQDLGNPLAGLGIEAAPTKVVGVDLTERELEARLLHLYRTARTQLEETGSNTLYVAIGLLRYLESATSTTPREAPLLLYPVSIDRKTVRRGFSLVRTDEEPLINAPLLQYLHQVHGFDCLPLAELPYDDSGVDVGLVFRRFRKLVEAQAGWQVLDAACVTVLSFTRFLMWRDLETRSRELMSNLAVRQLLTDDDTPWPSLATLPSAEATDERPVADVLTPLDADASQLAAVLAADAGHSFVLQGPPGTGKSQTITNLIAHALANGRTVLFVSEKMAALEVVHRRLEGAGLGPFCLELHSHHAQRADVVRQLQDAFDAAGRRSAHDWRASSAELQRLRDELSRYVRELHTPGTLGLSAYQAADALVAYQGRPDLPTVPVDLGPPDALDAAGFRTLIDATEALRELASEVDPAASPWNGVGWVTWQPERLAAVRGALAELERAADEVVHAGLAAGFDIGVGRDALAARGALADTLTRCPSPTRGLVTGEAWAQHRARVREWVAHGRRRTALWAGLAERWTTDLLGTELRPLHERFASWAERFLGWLVLWSPRRALGAVARGPLGAHGAVRDDLAVALEVRAEDAWLAGQHEAATALLGPYWAGVDTDFATVEALTTWADEFRALIARVDPALGARLVDEVTRSPERFVGRAELAALSRAVAAFTMARDAVVDLLDLGPAVFDGDDHLRAVQERVRAWRADFDGLRSWVAWNGAASRLRAAGVGAVLSVDPEDLPEVLRRSILAWWLDAWTGANEALREFHGLDHERRVARFRELDRESRALAAREVRARLAARVPSQGGLDLGEMGVLNRELRKKRGHLAIRKLFEAIPHVLQRIKPCVLMSPLSVAQFLDPALDRFDLVVFDEASQIPPWQAIGAMARGRQVVVVGDSKQLPPTTFFARGEDEAADEEARRDLESVLDECVAIGMPALSLDWHYRSRHESLIAFSNHHYYGDRLLTFPCARAHADDLGIELVPCDGAYDKGRTRTNRPEAEALVAHVVATLSDPSHARSVGIVTFSIAQQALIEDLLDAARARDPSLERWFGEVDEPVFVKNLENVQGDERDVIYFSVCYGPASDGGVSMNFGPLNRVGGERRLNVALTRARMALVVFTSLRSDAIDLSRTSAVGVRHLREFLRRAELEREGGTGRGAVAGGLVAEVAGRLEDAGYAVDGEVGASGSRIALGVRHPDDPGRYLLGIETDGAAYASCAATRDRERLRTEVLGRLGWSMHRVWALEWVRNPERAWGRVLDALDAARRGAPQVAASVSPVDADEDAPVAAHHPAYVLAEGLPGAATADQSLYHRHAERRVVEAIERVLAVEAPIHVAELVRRVGAGWGISRVTAKPRAHVEQLLGRLEPPPVVRGEFVWRADQDPASWRVVRVPGHARSADVIPPEEIAAAVEHCLRAAVSSTRTDLARGAAQLLGVARAGARVRAVVEAGIDAVAARGVCTVRDDVVTLADAVQQPAGRQVGSKLP